MDVEVRNQTEMSTSNIITWMSIAITAFSVGGLTYKFEEAKWEAALQKQKIEAQEELQSATLEVLERERKAREQIFELENKHQETLHQLSELDTKYKRLVRDAGGLRDKRRGESGSNSKGTNSGTGGNPETDSRILSRETTDFLLDLTAEADRMREQLRLCQDWARSISKQ